MPGRHLLAVAVAALGVCAAACSGPDPTTPSSSCDGAGVICAVAGTGRQGFNGDGHAAGDTDLNLPTSVRVGPDGLLYLMDFNNMRLRRRRADGTIETVAGNGVHAYAMAGAPATQSPLENPIDFAFAPDGHVLLVALHDPRVLRLEDDGTLGVVAGTGDAGDGGDDGPATAAELDQPSGIAVAPDGSVFVSDHEENRVRVIRPDGTIHAYAGTGETDGDRGDGGPATQAQLFGPRGLALDSEGNLFIADTIHQCIRRVDAATGIIETVAGTGTQGLSGDGGPATQAALRFPNGVSVGPDGALYIADTFNHRIRRVGPDGVITTVAGSSEGHAGDGGPATEALLEGPSNVEADGAELFIADTQNQVVRVLGLPEP